MYLCVANLCICVSVVLGLMVVIILIAIFASKMARRDSSTFALGADNDNVVVASHFLARPEKKRDVAYDEGLM